MTNAPTRGERNNNPGNVNFIEPPHNFNGQVGIEIIPPGIDETPRFGRYDSTFNGIRAMAELLIIYQRKDGCDTIRKIITRWAPAAENSDDPYVADVCTHMEDKLGAPEGEHLDPDGSADYTVPNVLEALVFGMISHENGRCLYSDGDLSGPIASALTAQNVAAGHE